MSRQVATLSSTATLCGTTPASMIGGSDQHARLAAARAAGAHAFVAELPEGYHTPVGHGGVVLTASQRLRLVVAGMIAADPPVIVVDDPTAGLDRTGETAVLPGLESLLRGREVRVLRASPAVRAAITRARSAPQGTPPPPPILARLPEDPGLPSLSRLLDASEMAPLLGGLLGGQCVDVRVHSTRYKPGDNIVVEYGVLTPSGWSTAVAYAHAGSKLPRKLKNPGHRKLARRVADRVPAARPFVLLPEVSALVQWMPLDVRLPVLADDAQRLTARLAKKGILVSAAEPELLRYWPRRRAVLRFGPYVLKLYREPGDFDQAHRNLRASASLQQLRTPGYKGKLKGRQVTVQEWIPGGAPSLAPASSDPAGAILADLHGATSPALRTTTPEALLAKAASRADFVVHLLPVLRREVAALLDDLEAKAPHGGPLVTSHGNFHAGQLLADPVLGMAMIDFDRLCLASPAYDVSSFAAHVAFGRPGDRAVVSAAIDSLVAGYGARPVDLEWYLSIALLRRAAVPFRFQDEHWPDAVAELVDHARAVLP
ncbi:MAG: phosphotransferase [Nocardioides sp.]